MRRNRKWLFALLAAVAMLAAACGSGENKSGDDNSGNNAKDPIRIGALESTTGPAATIGAKMQQGLELAVDQINSSGGVNGRQVKLYFLNPGGDTSTAVSQTRTLLTSDKVDAIVGGGSQSGIALAMKQATEKAGVLFMATEGAKEIVTPVDSSALTFKATFNDSAVIQRIIEFWKEKGITKVGFMPDTSGFGQSAAAALKEQAPKAGITVNSESFDPTATDLSPQITKLLGNSPQALLLWTTTGASTVFLKNAKQLVGSQKVLLMEGFGSLDKRYPQQAGDAGVGSIFAGPVLPIADKLPDSNPQKAVIKKFQDAFQAKFKTDANVYAGQAYDGMMIVAKAMSAAKSTDSKAVAKAIEKIKGYVGVTGAYNYSESDHSGLQASSVGIMQWDGDRFVPVDS